MKTHLRVRPSPADTIRLLTKCGKSSYGPGLRRPGRLMVTSDPDKATCVTCLTLHTRETLAAAPPDAGPTPMLVWKDEGRVGPAVLYRSGKLFDTSAGTVDHGWMTRAAARLLALRLGAGFAEF